MKELFNNKIRVTFINILCLSSYKLYILCELFSYSERSDCFMRKIWNKGHRIRASDKHLVYHFSIGTLLFLFVAVLLLLNIKQLMRTDWEHFSLLENGLTFSTYNFITIGIATGVCALVAFLYYRFCYDSFKKLLHRQSWQE